jgi:hypothetical protein
MTEPTGQTIEGEPWAEARGPHLPDRLTRIPLLVWPFVILAVIQVAGIWVANSIALATDPFYLLQAAFWSIADVTASLLGAALFLRHRDAVRTLPLVVIGVTLLAAEQVVQLLRVPLAPMLEAIMPVADDFTSSGPMLVSTFYFWGAAILGIAGLLYLARGLDEARRFDAPGGRALAAGLVAICILITVIGLVGNLRLPEGTIFGGPVVLALTTALGLASLLATSYLLVVAVRGWRAGEEPSLGWGLVAISGSATLIVFTVLAVASLLEIQDFGLLSPMFSTARAIAGVALLAAFLLALPSTDAVAWDEEDDADPTLDPPVATPPGSAGS